MLEEITERIIGIFRSNQFKAHAALLETLISIVFHVENMIEPFTEKLLEVKLDQVKNEDSLTKKVAVDAIYAITAIVKDKIIPFRLLIL